MKKGEEEHDENVKKRGKGEHNSNTGQKAEQMNNIIRFVCTLLCGHCRLSRVRHAAAENHHPVRIIIMIKPKNQAEKSKSSM